MDRRDFVRLLAALSANAAASLDVAAKPRSRTADPLLTAPQTGAETRADLRYGARRTTRALGRRSRNAWLDLRDELRGATAAITRRKARRAAERARRDELARESAT